jgi:hypothetical protein
MAFDLKTALGSIAPTIATMLGGPLAGAAVTALESALGVTPGGGEAAITKVVQSGMTPDSIAAVRKADQEHEQRLKQMDVDVLKLNADHEAALAQINAGDRESARQREVNTRDTWTPRGLAVGVTGGFFGVLAFMLANGKPAQGGDALLVMLGSLGTAWTAIIAYYFGSSAGSSRKDELLAQAGPVSK